MNKLELLRDLHHRLAGMTDEAPYCIMSRTLLTTLIDYLASRHQPDDGDPLLARIRTQTTRREYSIIECLNQSPGNIVTYDAILQYTGISTPDSLWTHACRLRKKAADHGWGQIGMIKKTGYIWIRPDSDSENGRRPTR